MIFFHPTSNSKNLGRGINTIPMFRKPLPLLPRHSQLIIIFLATIANVSVTRSHQFFLGRTIPRSPQLPQISGNLRQINNALPHLVQIFSSFDADIAASRINCPSHLLARHTPLLPRSPQLPRIRGNLSKRNNAHLDRIFSSFFNTTIKWADSRYTSHGTQRRRLIWPGFFGEWFW